MNNKNEEKETRKTREARRVGEIIAATFTDTRTDILHIPSGFPALDMKTGGWHDSDLIILASLPSVGKTAFALNIAANAAIDNDIPVAFFSLEMSKEQIVKRLVSAVTELNPREFNDASKMEPGMRERLESGIKTLSNAPIYIDDTPGLSIKELKKKAEEAVKNNGIRLIVIDYIQLMEAPAEYRGNREQEMASISRELKKTARELDIPIIALSQLSRNPVQRQAASGRPMLSDLRGSGSIEQDADMVIFIHRPDYIGMSENLEDREKVQIIIAKHRNGETGDINMVFKSHLIRFMEPDDQLYTQAGKPIMSRMNQDMPPVGQPDGDCVLGCTQVCGLVQKDGD